MGHDSKSNSKPSGDKDKSKKRHKHGDSEKGHDKKRKRRDEGGGNLPVADDDVDDEDMWVEKNIDMDGTMVSKFCVVEGLSVLSTCTAAHCHQYTY
jgi:hypothetical protein